MNTQPRNVRRARLGALALTTFLFSQPAVVEAAQGDCAQPVTNGSSPTASDCLFILRAAVGSATCDPACICAPKGSLPTTATDALLCLKTAVGQPVTLSCPCEGPQQGDDFDDDSKDQAKWGNDFLYGHGVLEETNQVLEYSCNKGTKNDQALRPWKASRFPYDADWKAQIDVGLFTVASDSNMFNSFGILVIDAKNPESQFFAELYGWAGPPPRNGFLAALFKNGNWVSQVDTMSLAVTTGAVRIAFDADTKVVTFFYDMDSGNGDDWVQYGSFGLAGSGGADGNTNWKLSKDDWFEVALYGYSSNMVVNAGEVYGDNFLAAGGIVR